MVIFIMKIRQFYDYLISIIQILFSKEFYIERIETTSKEIVNTKYLIWKKLFESILFWEEK